MKILTLPIACNVITATLREYDYYLFFRPLNSLILNSCNNSVDN